MSKFLKWLLGDFHALRHPNSVSLTLLGKGDAQKAEMECVLKTNYSPFFFLWTHWEYKITNLNSKSKYLRRKDMVRVVYKKRITTSILESFTFVYYECMEIMFFFIWSLELHYEEAHWEAYRKTCNIKMNLRFGAPPIASFEEWYLLSSRKISSQENEFLCMPVRFLMCVYYYN